MMGISFVKRSRGSENRTFLQTFVNGRDRRGNRRNNYL